MRMIERFKGDAGKRLLVDALAQQKIVRGNRALAEALADLVTLRHLDPGDTLITEGAADNDIYLVLSGTLEVTVKGVKVAERAANEVVGEMAAVDPTMLRTATVSAQSEALVARMSEHELSKIGNAHPDVFRHLAVLMAQKLQQRNRLVRPVHAKIRVFLISSVEALPIARAVHNAFSHDDFDVIPWQEGVFKATSYTLKTLEDEIDKADFAIAIAHADDIVEYKENDWPTPRDNVIFELGLFMGRLGTDRAILLEPRNNKVRLPSDLAGVTTITYRFEKSSADKAAMLAPACNQLRDYIASKGQKKDW